MSSTQYHWGCEGCAVQGEQKGNHELATEEDLSPGNFMQGIPQEFCFASRKEKENIKKGTQKAKWLKFEYAAAFYTRW